MSAEFSNNPNDNVVVGINTSNQVPTANDPTPHGSGVLGVTNVPDAAGVFGANNNSYRMPGHGAGGNPVTLPGSGVGVYGNGPSAGVRGNSDAGDGTQGYTHSTDQSGVFGLNDGQGSVTPELGRPGGAGVWGHTTVKHGTGIVGSVDHNLNDPDEITAGVTGISGGAGTLAGQFFGVVRHHGEVRHHAAVTHFADVNIVNSGDIKFGDCAEEFDVRDGVETEPGTVMVLDESGDLLPSSSPYDRRVAGVVSGGGDYRPAIILNREPTNRHRLPVALVGRVYCKVDADIAPIAAGDLLTTAPTLGHAMKATDPLRAFGAVIGKALRPLEAGKAAIPILIALQ
jgi:hypothetical protein